jgi:hypothetical protein
MLRRELLKKLSFLPMVGLFTSIGAKSSLPFLRWKNGDCVKKIIKVDEIVDSCKDGIYVTGKLKSINGLKNLQDYMIMGDSDYPSLLRLVEAQQHSNGTISIRYSDKFTGRREV